MGLPLQSLSASTAMAKLKLWRFRSPGAPWNAFDLSLHLYYVWIVNGWWPDADFLIKLVGIAIEHAFVVNFYHV